MKSPDRFRMTKMVVSFNRHFFVIAFVASVIGIVFAVLSGNIFVRALLIAGDVLACYFMVVSVIASYLIYDASDLYRLKWWPAKARLDSPKHGVLVHASFDPASPMVKAKFPEMDLLVLDFFDPQTLTEASIQRAHSLASPSSPQEKAPFDSWPVAADSQNVVFALSAAHELRKEHQRTAFFLEAKRVLNQDGTLIVIEQLRDVFNFVCFGAAAFHFLSRKTWLRSFDAAKLVVRDEFRITPFMRVFVLQKGIAAV